MPRNKRGFPWSIIDEEREIWDEELDQISDYSRRTPADEAAKARMEAFHRDVRAGIIRGDEIAEAYRFAAGVNENGTVRRKGEGRTHGSS